MENDEIRYEYDFFISYAHADKEMACTLYNYLTAHDIRCFFDIDDIYLGDRYQEKEKEYINKSQRVLFLFSQNCYDGEKVRKEIEFELNCALEDCDKGNKIIPFCIGDPVIKASIEPFIKGISAFKTTGDDPSSMYKGFLEKILNVIEPIKFLGDNEIEGLRLLMKEANKGDIESQIRMANYYLQPRQPKIEYEKAIGWFRKAEKNGDCSARLEIGHCYLNLIKPFLDYYHRNGDADEKFFREIRGIHNYTKSSEKWFRGAAEVSESANKEVSDRAYSGLLELLSFTLWLFYGNVWLPDPETMELLENVRPSQLSTQDKYRFCHVMYRLLDIPFYSESEKNKHGRISTTARTILLSWGEKEETDALLFLGAYNYETYWKHITVYDEEERGTIILDEEKEKNIEFFDKAVEYLNRAYHILGDDVLRYRLSDYFLGDSYEEFLWDRLITQDSFNPLGIQLFLSNNPSYLETWDDCLEIVNGLTLSTSEKYYYLGFGAVHINLSFTAVWLSCAIGHIKAKELLADYYFESLSLYERGCPTWVGYVDNMKSHIYSGGLSGDVFLDEEVRQSKITLGHIKRMDSSRFVAFYMRNLPKAVNLYRDVEDRYKLGRCYYWGLGVQKNEELAQRFGYSISDASKDEERRFSYWSNMVQEYNRRREEEEYLKTLEEQAPDYGESINSFLLKKKEKGKERDAEWRVHFPEIPCPLEYMS